MVRPGVSARGLHDGQAVVRVGRRRWDEAPGGDQVLEEPSRKATLGGTASAERVRWSDAHLVTLGETPTAQVEGGESGDVVPGVAPAARAAVVGGYGLT